MRAMLKSPLPTHKGLVHTLLDCWAKHPYGMELDDGVGIKKEPAADTFGSAAGSSARIK